jgi:hypothetical protein
MKKKIALILLVAILLFACTASAAPRLSFFINGMEAYPPSPPVIVDDRVMVPLRFIAEALDCEVEWKEPGTVIINDSNEKQAVNKLPAITGTDDFVQTINNAFALVKSKSPDLYNWLIAGSDRIVLYDLGDTGAINQYNSATGETIIKIGEKFFNNKRSDFSSQDLTIELVGVLGHEAEHTYLDRNSVYTPEDREVLCELAAVRVLEAVGGENSEYYKIAKGYINDHMKS